MKNFKVPHVYVILMVMVCVCAAMTYFIPAGQYEMMKAPDGRSVINPTTFQFIQSTPVGLMDILSSVPKGMVEAAGIIFFLFIVGGSFYIVEATGAIEAGLGRVTQKTAGWELAIIPVVMFVFSLGGAVFGMAEETLPFIPLLVMLAIALGFDSITGTAMALVGAGAGFTGAFMNPFTVGIGQGIAGLPLFSGMGYRIIVYILMTTITILYVYFYARKIKKNPQLSSMYEFDQTREEKLDMTQLKEFTTQHMIILFSVAASMGILVYGVVKLGWYVQEISALFLGMGIFCGLIGGLGLNGVAESLAKGMANIASGALVVGFARAILVILNEGHILDTILHSASGALAALPSSVIIIGMYVFQCLLHILVPSGSGQAAVSLPLLAPLSDMVGVTRQTAVLIYQLGDGLLGTISPTQGYFMAALALAKISWVKWAKWILPLFILQFTLGGILIIVAHYIGYGPF